MGQGFSWKTVPAALDCNTNNHHDRDPYWINEETDELVIDKEWWENEVPLMTKKLLKMRQVEYVLGTVPIPHEDQFDKRLVQVYQAFQEAYEMQMWYNGPCISFVVKKPEETEWDVLLAKVEKLIDPNETYFVKTGCTSGKNKVPIYPCRGAKEITNRLLENPELHMREWSNLQKESLVFLLPWNDKINARNEFRAFVAHGRITCLSPQRYWECHNYTVEELQAVEWAVNNLKDFPYKFCVIDLWVDFEERKAHLIEYNCFGDHSGAGSSLFHWIDDHDLLYGKRENVEIRFVSPVKIPTPGCAFCNGRDEEKEGEEWLKHLVDHVEYLRPPSEKNNNARYNAWSSILWLQKHRERITYNDFETLVKIYNGTVMMCSFCKKETSQLYFDRYQLLCQRCTSMMDE